MSLLNVWTTVLMVSCYWLFQGMVRHLGPLYAEPVVVYTPTQRDYGDETDIATEGLGLETPRHPLGHTITPWADLTQAERDLFLDASGFHEAA